MFQYSLLTLSFDSYNEKINYKCMNQLILNKIIIDSI